MRDILKMHMSSLSKGTCSLKFTANVKIENNWDTIFKPSSYQMFFRYCMLYHGLKEIMSDVYLFIR